MAAQFKRDAQTGQNGINLLIASGLESHDSFSGAADHWTRVEPHSAGNNSVIKAGETARNGTTAIKTFVNVAAPADSRMSGMYQDVTLEGSTTYTFSAYVNTSGIYNFKPADTTGGVYLKVMNSSGSTVASGDLLSYCTSSSIENGWQRVYVTFQTGAAGTYRCAVIQENAYGQAYFDDLQLEKGQAPSTANLLQDGTFNYSRNDGEREWTDTNLYIYPETNNESNYLGFIWGNPTGMKRGWQDVPINGPATQTYLLSG